MVVTEYVKKLQKQASIFFNDIVFWHEKSQNLTGGNSDKTTTKNKNLNTSVKTKQGNFSIFAKKNSSSK